MRLFVALDLPSALRTRLSWMAGGLQGARWVPPENYHITLRFIGEVPGWRAEELDQALAVSGAAVTTLQEQVRLAQQGEHQLQRALEAARHDFASELDKLRADGALAQERLKAAETRALLEIDRERQAAARLQKELDAANRKAEQGGTRHRDDVQKLQGQLGNLRQQVGVLEGKLDALRTANARYIDEAAQAREQRDQLALSLTNATARQKVPKTKQTAGVRTSSAPERKSPRTKRL